MTPQQPRDRYETQKVDNKSLYGQIVEIHTNEHVSGHTVATRLNISKSTVYNYLTMWKKQIPVEEIKPQGRPPKISSSQRSILGRFVSRQEVPTSKSLARSISSAQGRSISPRTVRRHLDLMGYKNSVPRPIPLLTPIHKQRRVEWCRKHADFDWKNVIFSDETYIEVNLRVTPIWHKSGARPTVSKPKFRAKIMCWGAISMRFKSSLAIVEGTMNSNRYIETLKTYLLRNKSKKTIQQMVFQQDGASCHTSKATSDFLSTIGLTVLPWPANSPDLNPIENIWAILKQNVENRGAMTKNELVKVVSEEWDALDMELINRTINSMKKRTSQVIVRQGLKCDY